MVPIIRTDLIIRTVWSCFDICFKVKKNVGVIYVVYYVKKSLGGKKWVVTFLRPVHKIGT